MVSDICLPMAFPVIEMSGGIGRKWRRIGSATKIAITITVMAKNFALPSF
jgi:hypothetical protein